MRLSLAVVALCAIPALANTRCSAGSREYRTGRCSDYKDDKPKDVLNKGYYSDESDKYVDYRHNSHYDEDERGDESEDEYKSDSEGGDEDDGEGDGENDDEHEDKSENEYKSDSEGGDEESSEGDRDDEYEQDRYRCSGHRCGTQHLKHPEKPDHLDKHELTEERVCVKLDYFADEANYIYDLVEALECGADNRCWEPVRKALYELEFSLDVFDTTIDKSKAGLDRCFTCQDESKIACCYKSYAEAIIRALNLINDETLYLEGDADKFILTAVNSLRFADFAFVYELARRMSCDEHIKEIMKKHGAIDGSTEGSIREAFAEFTFTPYIVGDDFKESSKHGE